VERLEDTVQRVTSSHADVAARVVALERVMADTSRSLAEISERIQRLSDSQLEMRAERAVTDRWLRNTALIMTVVSLVYGVLTAVNIGLA